MCNMGRKNKRDPQAKLTVEFFDLSRKAAKLREVPREQKKKKSTLDVMVAKRNGAVQIRLMLVDREMSKSLLKCIKKHCSYTKTR